MYTLKTMKEDKPTLPTVEWEKIVWKKTPYKGVFIHELKRELNPDNPKIPKYTVMALKMEPKAEIPLHRHNRELGWTETITLPNDGRFETQGIEEGKIIVSADSKIIVIHPGEIFGLKNIDSKPLYFYSKMKPGFTGYGEIEEVQGEKKLKH